MPQSFDAAIWRQPPQPLAPLLAGRYRVSPEAFQVDEQLGWQPSGTGPHLLLRVFKQSANTAWVAQELSRFAGCASRDVGYAGAKDRHAWAWQWFSVPDERGQLTAADWAGIGWQVVDRVRHQRKLRRGDHAGNRFRLELELEQAPDQAALEACRERLTAGVPNYFGPQRFGREGGNLEAVAAWLETNRLPRDRGQRGWVISAARSLLFNQVLAARVADGSWNRCLPGEVVDDELPTGPLWGRGRSAAADVAATVEQAALEPFVTLCDRLEHAGLQQERRALMLRPGDSLLQDRDRKLVLEFSLPRGAFATAVLQALGHLHAPGEGTAGQAESSGHPGGMQESGEARG